MIYFKCSQCSEHLEAPTSMVGEKIQCPVCKFPEEVPDDEEKIHLDLGISSNVQEVGGPSSGTKIGIAAPTQIKAFGGPDKQRKERMWSRDTVSSGAGACRTRIFHSRLSENAMEYMEDSINEWLDENPDIEIKFSNSTVGVVEGKKSESHIIVTVWY